MIKLIYTPKQCGYRLRCTNYAKKPWWKALFLYNDYACNYLKTTYPIDSNTLCSDSNNFPNDCPLENSNK